jgi:hypothetical protein
VIRLPRLRRRRARLNELSEAEAYARSYGTRSDDVRAVRLEPRRPRFQLRVSGEELRRRFEERLNARRSHES